MPESVNVPLNDAGNRWVAHVQKPLDVLAVVFLGAVILLWAFPGAPPAAVYVLDGVMALTWLVFAVDYVVRVTLAVDRRMYMRTHKLDLLMVLVPMLRLLRIALLIRRALANVSTERIAGSIVSLVVLFVLASAFFMWRFEVDAPDASITTFRNAVWWAVVTTTTVGYGDYTPVTQVGRMIAMLVMIVGIGLIGTVSATVAAWFVSRRGASQDPDDDEAPDITAADSMPLDESEILRRLAAIEESQAELRALLIALQRPQSAS
jgi:voltage-gated potassium channel